MLTEIGTSKLPLVSCLWLYLYTCSELALDKYHLYYNVWKSKAVKTLTKTKHVDNKKTTEMKKPILETLLKPTWTERKKVHKKYEFKVQNLLASINDFDLCSNMAFYRCHHSRPLYLTNGKVVIPFSSIQHVCFLLYNEHDFLTGLSAWHLLLVFIWCSPVKPEIVQQAATTGH